MKTIITKILLTGSLVVVGCDTGGGDGKFHESDPSLLPFLHEACAKINSKVAHTGRGVDPDEIEVIFQDLHGSRHAQYSRGIIAIDPEHWNGPAYARRIKKERLMEHEVVHALFHQNGLSPDPDHSAPDFFGVPTRHLDKWR